MPSSVRQVCAGVRWPCMQFRVSLAEKAIARHSEVKQINYPDSLALDFIDLHGRANLASDGGLTRDLHDE